jgi:hypothetical protein
LQSELDLTGETMTDPAIYRKYAEECLPLATTAPENDRSLMEHAYVWLKLAEEAERKQLQRPIHQ